MANIKFNKQDIINFSKYSLDSSFLHMNEEYARRIPFGECIVFGGLGALACLGNLSGSVGMIVLYVEAEYLLPIH